MANFSFGDGILFTVEQRKRNIKTNSTTMYKKILFISTQIYKKVRIEMRLK
jgi:hypothetical protein